MAKNPCCISFQYAVFMAKVWLEPRMSNGRTTCNPPQSWDSLERQTSRADAEGDDERWLTRTWQTLPDIQPVSSHNGGGVEKAVWFITWCLGDLIVSSNQAVNGRIGRRSFHFHSLFRTFILLSFLRARVIGNQLPVPGIKGKLAQMRLSLLKKQTKREENRSQRNNAIFYFLGWSWLAQQRAGIH